MKHALRFVPDKVMERDFRKWARAHYGNLPRSSHDDYSNLYICQAMTAEDLEEVFSAGFRASEERQRSGGAGCGQ